MPRLDTASLLRSFLEDGFVRVPGLLDQDARGAIEADVARIFGNAAESIDQTITKDDGIGISSKSLNLLYEKNPNLYVGCMRAAQLVPSLHRVGWREDIVRILGDLGLRFPAYSTVPLYMMHHPSTALGVQDWRMPAHQDWRSIQGSLNCTICWISLRDVTADMGPLEVVPGSHRLGLLPTQKDEWFRHVEEDSLGGRSFVPVDTRAGDALFFSAFLVHRSGTNTGTEHRRTIQFRYNDLADESFVRRGYPTPYNSRPDPTVVSPGFPTPEQLDSYWHQYQPTEYVEG